MTSHTPHQRLTISCVKRLAINSIDTRRRTPEHVIVVLEDDRVFSSGVLWQWYTNWVCDIGGLDEVSLSFQHRPSHSDLPIASSEGINLTAELHSNFISSEALTLDTDNTPARPL
jgi:hypothetical protein